MVPAKGLGWPDQRLAWSPDSAGLHHGHAEPEGPELSDGPRADSSGFPVTGASGSPAGEIGLGWPRDDVAAGQSATGEVTAAGSAAAGPEAAQGVAGRVSGAAAPISATAAAPGRGSAN